jgi:hypothetical protein
MSALAEAGHGIAIIPSVLRTDRYKLKVVRVTRGPQTTCTAIAHSVGQAAPAPALRRELLRKTRRIHARRASDHAAVGTQDGRPLGRSPLPESCAGMATEAERFAESNAPSQRGEPAHGRTHGPEPVSVCASGSPTETSCASYPIGAKSRVCTRATHGYAQI